MELEAPVRRHRRVAVLRVEALAEGVEQGDARLARVGALVEVREERAGDPATARLRGDGDAGDGADGDRAPREPAPEREQEGVRDDLPRLLDDVQRRELAARVGDEVLAPLEGAPRIGVGARVDLDQAFEVGFFGGAEGQRAHKGASVGELGPRRSAKSIHPSARIAANWPRASPAW